MKKNLLVVPTVLALSSSVYAAQRGQADLMFMPEASQFQMTTEVVMHSGSYETNTTFPASNNKASSKHDTSALSWENTVSFGVMEQLTVGVGLNYKFKDEDEHKSGTDTGGAAITSTSLDAKTNNPGLENIKLNARYRVMDEGANVDLLAQVAIPVIADEKSNSYAKGGSNVSNDGNASEAAAFKLGAEVGKKHSGMQWRGRVLLAHGLEHDVKQLNYDSTGSGLDLDVKGTQKAYTDFNVGVAADFHITSLFLLGGSVDGTFVGKRESNYTNQDGSKESVTETSRTDLKVGGVAKYEFTNALMGKVSADYLIGGDYDYALSGASGLSTKNKIKNRNDLRLGVGFNFLF